MVVPGHLADLDNQCTPLALVGLEGLEGPVAQERVRLAVAQRQVGGKGVVSNWWGDMVGQRKGEKATVQVEMLGLPVLPELQVEGLDLRRGHSPLRRTLAVPLQPPQQVPETPLAALHNKPENTSVHKLANTLLHRNIVLSRSQTSSLRHHCYS